MVQSAEYRYDTLSLQCYTFPSMKFVRADTGVAERAIAKSICDNLYEGKRVLWLISGGSNVVVEKTVMDMVRDHASERSAGLAVMPIDERYGPPGHADCNVQKLREAGFDPGDATLVDVLVHNQSFDQTVSFYNDVASTALANADVVISQYGMGPDGHVAGIKPGSPATEVDESTVAGYAWEDYMRMTLMPAALRQAAVNFVVAYGADKKKPLEELRKKDMPFTELPAMLLYELSNVKVFNDQMGTRPKV
jgi:6-phosphogluconolactonase/glucosamine-6-phosphate isomerase/deaminase